MNEKDRKMATLCQVYLRIMRITLHAGHINHIPFFKSNLTRDIALKLNDLGKTKNIFFRQEMINLVLSKSLDLFTTGFSRHSDSSMIDSSRAL